MGRRKKNEPPKGKHHLERELAQARLKAAHIPGIIQRTGLLYERPVHLFSWFERTAIEYAIEQRWIQRVGRAHRTFQYDVGMASVTPADIKALQQDLKEKT